MALIYPGTAAIPQYESSLAAFMPAFDAGRKERKDSDAFDAAARAFGGNASTPAPAAQPGPLERLMGVFGGGQQQQPSGPYTRPQPPANAVAAIDAAAPPQTLPTNTMISDTSNIPAGYLASARASESGGNDAAANPNSSALGRYQFLESTWGGLMQQYPELGLTPQGRTDPAQQERAMAQFTQDNARALSGAGIPVDPGTLYAAHFLGAGGAQKALTADPATPMAALVEPGVIQANPQLADMTAGDFAQWAQRKGGNQSGGYAPPAQDVGAGQGKPFQVDETTMRTMLASDAMRPAAISLIQAQQESQASEGRYVTEQGQDGAVFQRDTLTGETKVLLTPDQANAASDETFFGNPVPFEDAEGNIQFGQIGNKGTFRPIQLGEGGQFVSPTKTVNTETEQIVMDQFGNVLSRMPIQNAQAAQDTAFGKGMGEAQAAGVLAAPQAVSNADTLLSQIDSVLQDPALDQAIGLGGILPAIAGTDQAGVVTRIEQLQGQAFLQAFQSLKGGGAITETEGKAATNAIARLSRIQNKEDFTQALSELRDIVVAAQRRAAEKGGMPPASAAPASPSAPNSSAGPVPITDDAGFDALPSGTRFIGPDGQERIKP